MGLNPRPPAPQSGALQPELTMGEYYDIEAPFILERINIEGMISLWKQSTHHAGWIWKYNNRMQQKYLTESLGSGEKEIDF